MKPLRPRRAGPARPFRDGILADFSITKEPGNERVAMQRVVDAVNVLHLETPRLERLKTAVAEATMQAIERGSGNAPELGIGVRVAVLGDELRVTIAELGGGIVPVGGGTDGVASGDTAGVASGKERAERPSAGDFGLALVARMVDELRTQRVPAGQEIELVVRLKRIR